MSAQKSSSNGSKLVHTVALFVLPSLVANWEITGP